MPGGAQNEWNKLRQSPRDWRILRFLRRKPVPVKLIGETEDGDELTVAITSSGPTQWTDATRALHSCVKIRALDKDGSITRVLELDPNDPELAAEAELEQSKAITSRRGGGAGAVPVISIDVPKLVDNIASNMERAFTAGGNHQATAFREGFAAMTSVVNLCLTLLVRVESRLATAEERVAEQAEQVTAGQPSSRDQLAAIALQKVLGGGGGAPGGVSIDPSQIGAILQHLQGLANAGAGGAEPAGPNGHA